jgi:hypothetical protein
MHHSFKLFTKSMLMESGYGIPHVEDLPIETFLLMLKKLPQLTAVQKLDGANLLIGRDVQGKLFASREQKGGQRFYKPNEMPKRSAYDGFRAALAACLQINDILSQNIKPGQTLSCEILFGEQPNTVVYGKDGLSYIAFLEPCLGDDPTIALDQNLPGELAKLLAKKQVTTMEKANDTTDGENIVRAPKNVTWAFTSSDVVSPKLYDSIDLSEPLAQLEKYLKQPNKIALSQGEHLSNYDVLTGNQPKLSNERKKIGEDVRTNYKIPIKKQLMRLLKKCSPSLSREKGPVGSEGLIFKDLKSSEVFKVVDRDDFTTVNKFNYEIRNKIIGRVASSDPNLPLEQRGGIVGNARTRCALLLGIPGIELPSRTKKVLEPMAGSTKQHTLKNIVTALGPLSCESAKRKMGAIITSALHDLEDELDAFKAKGAEATIKLSNGADVGFTPEVRRRTLLTFADSRAELMDLLQKIRMASGKIDLVTPFIGRAVEELHPVTPDEEQA